MSYDRYTEDLSIGRQMREQRIAQMLALQIFPECDRTSIIGDPYVTTAQGSVSESKFDEAQIPEALQEAARLGGNIDIMLRERHLVDIFTAAKGGNTRGSLNYHQNIYEVAGHEFEDEVSYEAFGYSWYRKYTFKKVGDGELIILKPWMQPWYEGGSPFPRAYGKGALDPAAAEQITYELCAL